jgi:hypothetical protein
MAAANIIYLNYEALREVLETFEEYRVSRRFARGCFSAISDKVQLMSRVK